MIDVDEACPGTHTLNPMKIRAITEHQARILGNTVSIERFVVAGGSSCVPVDAKHGRYRPSDKLLAFLEAV